jgi:hypothetical protein
MDRHEVEEFESVAGRQLDRLGYERSSVSPRPWIRARAWIRVFIFGATSAFPRVRVRWRRLTRARADAQGRTSDSTT